jgi:hypothetical protein
MQGCGAPRSQQNIWWFKCAGCRAVERPAASISQVKSGWMRPAANQKRLDHAPLCLAISAAGCLRSQPARARAAHRPRKEQTPAASNALQDQERRAGYARPRITSAQRSKPAQTGHNPVQERLDASSQPEPSRVQERLDACASNHKRLDVSHSQPEPRTNQPYTGSHSGQ